jgi:hypothetical protein
MKVKRYELTYLIDKAIHDVALEIDVLEDKTQPNERPEELLHNLITIQNKLNEARGILGNTIWLE